MEVPSLPRLGHAFLLIGKITDEKVHALITDMLPLAGRKDITVTLMISSSGGQIDAGMGLCRFLEMFFDEKLTTVVLGEASSIAVPVFLAGSTRYISPCALMTFHQMMTNRSGEPPITLRSADHNVIAMKARDDVYIRELVIRCQGKLDEQTARKLLEDERTINAEEAIGLGLAHTFMV